MITARNKTKKHDTSHWDNLPGYIYHHTITTGHCRRSDLSEVGKNLGLETHVDEMLQKPTPIPNFNGMFAQAVETDCTLAVDVLAKDRQLLVRFVVSRNNDSVSRALFADLLENDTLRVGSTEPKAPYCSASISFAGLLQSQDLYWIADYERCIAWTWLAMTAARGSDHVNG